MSARALQRVKAFVSEGQYAGRLTKWEALDLRAVVALAERAVSPSLANDLWRNDAEELRALRKRVVELERRVADAHRLVTRYRERSGDESSPSLDAALAALSPPSAGKRRKAGR
jgi:hypothetical protein